MVMMQGRVAAEYDAAAHTLLASAVTDAGADRDVNTAVAIDTLLVASGKGAANVGHAYWDNSEIPLGMFAVNIWISAISGVASTFAFALEAHTSTDFSSARVVVGTLNLTTVMGVGFYRLLIDSKTMQLMAAGSKYVALSTTKATASPSVTYTAWLGFICA